MAFNLMTDPGDTVYVKVRPSTAAYTKGDAVMLDRTTDAYDVVPATAATTTNNIYGVAMETVAASSSSLLIAIITEAQKWTATTTSNTDSTWRYKRHLLTDKATVANTSTDITDSTGIFLQTGEIGAVSNKVIIGKFLKTPGVSV
jgi:hypothetical protein